MPHRVQQKASKVAEQKLAIRVVLTLKVLRCYFSSHVSEENNKVLGPNDRRPPRSADRVNFECPWHGASKSSNQGMALHIYSCQTRNREENWQTKNQYRSPQLLPPPICKGNRIRDKGNASRASLGHEIEHPRLSRLRIKLSRSIRLLRVYCAPRQSYAMFCNTRDM